MASGSFDLGWDELFEDSLSSTQQVVEVLLNRLNANDSNFESKLSVDGIFEEIE